MTVSRRSVFFALLLCSGGALSAQATARAPKIKVGEFRETWKTLSPDERAAVVRKYGIKQTALYLNRDYQESLDHDYKVQISRETLPNHIKAQSKSGRCWLFSTTTVLEGSSKERLSQSFVNYHAWQKRAATLGDRALRSQKPIQFDEKLFFGEGGWFSGAAELIAEHGIVLEKDMPDTADAKNSALYEEKLAELVVALQHSAKKVPAGRAGADARKALKAGYLADVQKLLDTALGKPPETVIAADGKRYSPKAFATDYLKFNPDDYLLLSRYSQTGMGYNTAYTLKQPLGFKPLKLYNVSTTRFMNAIRKSIDHDEAVWFSTRFGGSNPYIVGLADKVPAGARGAMSLGAFDYDSVIPNFKLTRRELGDSYLGRSNHAMAFVAYDYDEKHPRAITKLKVDNSHGTSKNKKEKWDGHEHLYADYLDKYVDTIVVRRDALPKKFVAQLMRSVPKKLPITIE